MTIASIFDLYVFAENLGIIFNSVVLIFLTSQDSMSPMLLFYCEVSIGTIIKVEVNRYFIKIMYL